MGDTKECIAVMGDWGYDHIIVPFAHNLKSYKHYRDKGGKPEHVFAPVPGGATNSEGKVAAGSLLTYRLLEKFHDEPLVEFLPKLLKDSEPSEDSKLSKADLESESFWDTYSEWLLCEKDKIDRSSHPLWRNRYEWKVYGSPKGIPTIETFGEYDKLVIRDVFLESGDKSLFNSIEKVLSQTFDISNKVDKPLVFLRSIVKRKSDSKKNMHDNDALCEADFRNPSIFERLLAKQKKKGKDILNHTVLLLEVMELKTYGAALQDALSWDSLLEETAHTVRQIANFWKYLAIVVSFHGLGALLYLPGGSNPKTKEAVEGEFTLVYYPGDIENLTGLNSTYGMFGNTTILHVALAHNFKRESMESTAGDKLDPFHKKQRALEDAIAAGLYASRKLLGRGTLRAASSYDPKDTLYKAEKDTVRYPLEDVCSYIDDPKNKEDYQAENKKRIDRFKKERDKKTKPNHQIEKNNSSSLPYIFRVKEGAFISDDEASEGAKHPSGMYSKPRKFPVDDALNGASGGILYPFESILKEALYQTHEYTNDLPQNFDIAFTLEDEKKWQHHRQKLTLKNTKNLSFELLETSILFQLCKNIVQYGKSRYRTIALYKQNRDGSYPDRGIPLDEVFLSGTPFAIPYLTIGDYLAYDDTEIKQTCDINKLLRDYAKDTTRHKPTSICVFGQPGAGKSFLVEQLANSMKEVAKSGLEPELLLFNVSQMESTEKLIDAWHRVRDAVLRNKLPFVFFDEFDCTFDGHELGWLKHFISPMQDGTFVGGRGHLHQIGKAVFIFAGGMYESMADFRKGIRVGEKNLKSSEERKINLRKWKHPDFVSRIRGFVNVSGPNERREGGMLHYLRRATILRGTLLKRLNVGKNDFIDIDKRVLSAFINVKTYHNNTRSLQGIIELSSCPLNGPLGVSNIYVDDTLDLYVSPDFADYLRGD